MDANKAIYKTLSTEYPDVKLTFNVVNSDDHDKKYFSIKNGEVVKDIASDIKVYEPSAEETNALQTAYSYLNYTAFSKKGLKKQLKFEGFSSKDADFAVETCGADWYEQAVKMAESYLDYSSFSKKGLKKQLKYEGFTSSQASYAVKKAYK